MYLYIGNNVELKPDVEFVIFESKLLMKIKDLHSLTGNRTRAAAVRAPNPNH